MEAPYLFPVPSLSGLSICDSSGLVIDRTKSLLPLGQPHTARGPTEVLITHNFKGESSSLLLLNCVPPPILIIKKLHNHYLKIGKFKQILSHPRVNH